MHVMDLVRAILLFSTFIFLFYSISEAFRRRQQKDLQNRLIDKFSSAQDLANFLQSAGGQKFISDLSEGSSHPSHPILRSIQAGVIMTLLGIGCLVWMTRYVDTPLPIIGTLLLCLGAGFLISAAISYKLSKEWGLMDKNGRKDQNPNP